MKTNNYIKEENCDGCNLCLVICPEKVIKNPEKKKYEFDQDKLHLCIKCGHCMAICPTKALHIEGLNYEKDFFELPKHTWDGESFHNFVASRRSVRVYKDKPVPLELLEKILEMISMAPMGFTPHKIEVTVVKDKANIEKAVPLMVKFYENMQKWMKNPAMRFIIKKNSGLEGFTAIKDHVIPKMKANLSLMKNSKEDIITRNAPAMLLFHAKPEAEVHSEDIFIELTYGLLAAHSLGLGAAAIDLIPPAIQRTEELRKMFAIPDKNEVLAAMILGYPKYHFRRGIKRKLANVTWI
jgi:nitroreductase/Pyruvate/2-oxoacid:ferredoxin oxidoreductase delta subunit